MCSQVINYKAYQQVLDLASDKKRTTKAARPTQSGPKKRTKSGCLTCRRRKKKCDEEKVGGKCQACIRNFLDCCWPGESVESAEVPVSAPVLKKEEVATPTKGASAYPSPISSPKAEAADECKDIKPFALSGSKFKVSKPKTKTPARRGQSQFVVTSFDLDRALCQVKV